MRLRTLSEVLAEHPEFEPGWRRGEGDVVLVNAPFGRHVHAVVCHDDGTPAYDVPVHSGPVGAVVVPVLEDGRVAFIRIFRPAAGPPATPAYPRVDLSAQGTMSLELPRGFPEPGETPEDAGRREVREETGFEVAEIRHLGYCNPNTSYELNSVPLLLARVSGKAAPLAQHAHEGIERVVLLGPDALTASVREGKIFCGFTLAAVAAYLATRSFGDAPA